MALHKDDPRTLGGYRIVDRLGAGGMGVVYRGRSRSGREVAVKVVHAQYAEDAVFRTRFRQEIEAVRKVSGAFTAPVVDADPEADRPWMATQYVPGPTLAAHIRAHGPLRGAHLRRLALGLVEALREIHRAGVVHRDLKPGNVLMAPDGPRVIDFGISRAAENQTLTETGKVIGTPPFMSPEQLADARSVGPASDVFSLGALLVFAATGRGPFDADSPYLTAWRVLQEEPKVEAVAEPLRAVLTGCLTKDPLGRPELDALAQQFARVLPEPADGDAQTMTLRLPPAPTAEEPGPAVAARRPGRRSRLRRWPAAAAAAGVLALALTGYVVFDPFPGGGRSQASNSADDESARWDPLPKGWRPWRTSLFGTAASGVARPLASSAGTGTVSVSCVGAGGALYCGGNGTLPVRIDGATGRLAWRAGGPSRPVPAGYDSLVLGVDKGVVLVSEGVLNSTRDDTIVTAVALDAVTGKRLWSHGMHPGGIESAVVGDLLLAPDGNRVTARDLVGGAVRWTATLPVADGYSCRFHAFEGLPPYVGCSYGRAGTRNVFYAVDPADGSTRKLAVPDGYVDPLGAVGGELVFGVISPSDREGSGERPYGAVLLIDPDTGAVRRKTLPGGPRGRAALVGGVLCVADSRGRMVAHSARTGARLWETSTTLQQPGTPVGDGRGRAVFAASASGRVAAVDVRTGALLWESSARAGRVEAFGVSLARVFLDEGSLIVLTPDGTVFTVNPAHPDRLSPGE
ncbi:protein kinase domain-containing protein [Streptomyces hilarionis]|uniref:protein kinase domain-containing protein n=1 Tax=Streptomyces hilarionis TaxID=2839954 RepID=UPI00211A5C99|nr:serine/threonine-protein kinase [Streptomyces hilarionis]MCQ9134294.1 serine/threonine-protein kinase [Streptomyces hilarionis]